MPLRLTIHRQTHIPLDFEGVLPETLVGKTLAQIEQFPILHGNRVVPLSEFFRIEGDAADETLVLEGNLAGVHRLGAKMRRGRIHLRGSAGRHVASEMVGGEIDVEGDAGDWLGAQMRGGLVRVRGDAASGVGAAYAGSPRGMSGGTILVHGRAGHEVGAAMRRGTIAIGGAAGDFLGTRMLAGTIFVFGAAGQYPGVEMRRGTIGLFGNRPTLLPSFRRGATFQPPMLRLLLRQLRALDFPIDPAHDQLRLELHHGDLLALGRGEILLPAT